MKKIRGKGIEITEQDGAPLTSGNYHYWDAQFANILRDKLGDYIPFAEYQVADSGDGKYTTLFSWISQGGKELCSRSRGLDDGVKLPEEDVQRFIAGLEELHQMSNNEDLPQGTRDFLRYLRVPDPAEMPQAWRVNYMGFLGLKRKLSVLWGYETKAGASILPLTTTSAEWSDGGNRSNLALVLNYSTSNSNFNWGRLLGWLILLIVIILLLGLLLGKGCHPGKKQCLAGNCQCDCCTKTGFNCNCVKQADITKLKGMTNADVTKLKEKINAIANDVNNLKEKITNATRGNGHISDEPKDFVAADIQKIKEKLEELSSGIEQLNPEKGNPDGNNGGLNGGEGENSKQGNENNSDGNNGGLNGGEGGNSKQGKENNPDGNNGGKVNNIAPQITVTMGETTGKPLIKTETIDFKINCVIDDIRNGTAVCSFKLETTTKIEDEAIKNAHVEWELKSKERQSQYSATNTLLFGDTFKPVTAMGRGEYVVTAKVTLNGQTTTKRSELTIP